MNRSRARRLGCWMFLAGCVGVVPTVGAQEETLPAAPEVRPAPEFALGGPVRHTLARLQDGWLEWLSATYQRDGDRASAAVTSLVEDAAQLGFPRLPELSVAAAAQAVSVAREGDASRAANALEAAEKLDPGRPETAFAEAEMRRREGRRWSALKLEFEGWRRSLREPALRSLLIAGLVRWLMVVGVLAAVAYLALMAVVRGPASYRMFVDRLAESVPTPAAHAIVMAAWMWPILLPGGPLWLAAYWTILLWGDQTGRERAGLVAGWVVVAAAPFVLAVGEDRISVELSPEVSAVRAAAAGRLEGAMFAHLAVLEDELPDRPEVEQLIADVHYKLGQWDQARPHYRRVLEAEPRNARARGDLAACFYYRGEYDQAIEGLEVALQSEPEVAAIHFNLSQAHSEIYRFEESRASLTEAQKLDRDAVGSWILEAGDETVVPLLGGLARIEDVRRAFGERERIDLLTRLVQRPAGFASLWAALAAVFGSMVATPLVQRLRGGVAPEPQHTSPRWLRTVVPGLAGVEDGRGVFAYLTLVLVVGILALGLLDQAGYAVPWGLLPRTAWLPWVSVTSLAMYFIGRAVREARDA